MRRSRNRRRRPSETDAVVTTAPTDLFMAFGGVFLVLLLAALCAIGVPDFSREEVEEERRKRKVAEAQKNEAIIELVDAHKKTKSLEVQVATAQSMASGAVNELANAIKGQEEAEQKAKEATIRRAVDVVIVVDCTGSMSDVIAELRSCIDILSVVGPALCPEFRLGVVAYREDVAVLALAELDAIGLPRWKTFAYENTVRTEVKERLGDLQGRYEMLPHLSAVNSRARIDLGIRRALRELPESSKDRHRVLCVAADVGPWETGSLGTIESNERRIEDDLVLEVERFAAEENSTVLALFTGAENDDMHLRSETRSFFKRLAGTEGTYSERASEITAAVLRASLLPGGGS